MHTDDVSAIIIYKDGRHQKRETGYGNSFLSQSGRFITIDSTISSIEITNSKGKMRKVSPLIRIRMATDQMPVVRRETNNKIFLTQTETALNKIFG
ncbi:MAG: hypothetical protein WDM78_01625 [Puia sp.]